MPIFVVQLSKPGVLRDLQALRNGEILFSVVTFACWFLSVLKENLHHQTNERISFCP